MPVDSSVVQKQIEALGKIDSFGTKKEIKHLPELLSEGEEIKALCSGLMDGKTWLCVVTDVRFLLVDKGLIGGLSLLEMPISQVKSISYKTGFLFADLLIDTGGQIKKLENLTKEDAPKVAAIVSDLLHRKKESAPAPKAQDDSDIVSKLERLAAMREKGILTDEEFAQQKAKLLA